MTTAVHGETARLYGSSLLILLFFISTISCFMYRKFVMKMYRYFKTAVCQKSTSFYLRQIFILQMSSKKRFFSANFLGTNENFWQKMSIKWFVETNNLITMMRGIVTNDGKFIYSLHLVQFVYLSETERFPFAYTCTPDRQF